MNTGEMQLNSKSVIGLTLGILSILIPFIGLLLGVIGLILSIISRKEIAREKQKGSGLALAGLICSIAGIIFQLFIFLGVATFITVPSVS